VSDPQYGAPQGGGQPSYVLPAPASSGSGVKMAILFGAVIALIAANVYLFLQIDTLKQEMAKNRDSILEEVGRVKESSSVTSAAARRNMDTLKEELEAARRQASMAVGQAKVDATKHAEELAARLASQQKASEAAMKGQISKVEEAATTANTKIGEVATDVSGVKTDLSNTKSELDKTIASLKTVSGDLGVQSGLIATNGKELQALKALGERNYFEFNLAKTKAPQKVGDIFMQLKKTDNKKNKYTVEITADDKRVEKKDKGVNEPVQFYTSKARQPYEIVVNEVKKDVIVGYLATPKVQSAR
jgi:chromosome segregation ATPase